MKPNRNNGFSLIEVLVTIVILLIGLLGLAGLQLRALSSQMESYQRSQALILLKDMAGRIDNNRVNVASYITPRRWELAPQVVRPPAREARLTCASGATLCRAPLKRTAQATRWAQ